MEMGLTVLGNTTPKCGERSRWRGADAAKCSEKADGESQPQPRVVRKIDVHTSTAALSRPSDGRWACSVVQQ